MPLDYSSSPYYNIKYEKGKYMESEMATSIIIIVLILTIWTVDYIATAKKMQRYIHRLKEKDRIIHKMVKALPILFVENHMEPDPSKVRDGEFGFHVETRPEYDGKHIRITWAFEGVKKKEYNASLLRYFFYLESMGLEIHPHKLNERPLTVMMESFYEFTPEEMLDEEQRD